MKTFTRLLKRRTMAATRAWRAPTAVSMWMAPTAVSMWMAPPLSRIRVIRSALAENALMISMGTASRLTRTFST